MKRKFLIAATVLLVICALFFAALRPVVFFGADLPEGYREAIEFQAKGVYSKKLPLIPVFVSVDSFSQEKVTYTIYYFPFGTVGMSYLPQDGYNIETPLTRS